MVIFHSYVKLPEGKAYASNILDPVNEGAYIKSKSETERNGSS